MHGSVLMPFLQQSSCQPVNLAPTTQKWHASTYLWWYWLNLAYLDESCRCLPWFWRKQSDQTVLSHPLFQLSSSMLRSTSDVMFSCQNENTWRDHYSCNKLICIPGVSAFCCINNCTAQSAVPPYFVTSKPGSMQFHYTLCLCYDTKVLASYS
jgi:hypothetical protein